MVCSRRGWRQTECHDEPLDDAGDQHASLINGACCLGGEVGCGGTGVLDDLVEPDLGTNLVTGLDVGGLSRGVEGAGVATEVLRVDDIGGEGGHVGVVVLADVVVVTTNGSTVDHQLGEDVVAVDHGRCQQRRGERVKRLREHCCSPLCVVD